MPIFPVARAPVDVGPADEGRRLSIRYRPEGMGNSERQIVGVLDRWSGGLTDGILRVRQRDGAEIGVRVNEIRAMRVMPPELSVYAIQRLAQEGWPPMDNEELGKWSLRASQGATGRANSVRVAGLPPRSIRAALAHVVEWYTERRLPPKLQLPRPSGMSNELDAEGWVGVRKSRMMVNSVSRLLTATQDSAEREDLDIEVAGEPNTAFWEMLPAYTQRTEAEYHHVMTAVRPAAFVYCRNAEGTLLGIAHACLQGEWAGLTTIVTVSQSRRRGVASAVTASLARWAAEHGATSWYLQMFEDNAAALAFNERVGYTTHHLYEYRWPGDVPEPWAHEHF